MFKWSKINKLNWRYNEIKRYEIDSDENSTVFERECYLGKWVKFEDIDKFYDKKKED